MEARGITLCMSEKSVAGKTSSGATWVSWSVVVIVLYLLSPGFFVAVYCRWGWDPPLPTLAIFYSPVELLKKWEPADDFYTWYMELCAGQHLPRRH